jgi:hypothetical protein
MVESMFMFHVASIIDVSATRDARRAETCHKCNPSKEIHKFLIERLKIMLCNYREIRRTIPPGGIKTSARLRSRGV